MSRSSTRPPACSLLPDKGSARQSAQLRSGARLGRRLHARRSWRRGSRTAPTARSPRPASGRRIRTAISASVSSSSASSWRRFVRASVESRVRPRDRRDGDGDDGCADQAADLSTFGLGPGPVRCSSRRSSASDGDGLHRLAREHLGLQRPHADPAVHARRRPIRPPAGEVRLRADRDRPDGNRTCSAAASICRRKSCPT